MTSNNNAKADGSSSNKESQPQNTIGHYVLGKALGEGTFGKVKLGTHILTGEKVAVKVLEKSRIKDKKDVERISREIKILKQLHHPNVVQIYEIIETEKDLYLVMEFVQGGELFDLIVQNQRLKEKQACKYFQELISGIAYIHQLGICHRDLKPENLLVDYDQSLKIVDFGLSNLYEQGNLLKTACGSPCYAAPEMIAGQRYDGLMSDLWSCGVVLYAMLCGYLPYEDQKTSDLYKKILNAEYNLPDFLSEDAKDMIAKIFNTDPNKRINIDQIRKHPWYQIHKPETPSFHVCPPNIQVQRSDIIQKQGKLYRIVQRPNLLNQKIISNLETQQGFNRESLLKSIKNNKHNHLTATYYLLLKKHMIRHLKPYTDAFMELKQVEEKEFNENTQKPQIQLKSHQVSQAIKNKEIPTTSEIKIKTEKEVQKQFQSIDHNLIMNGTENGQSIDNRHEPKKQNFVNAVDYNNGGGEEQFYPQTSQQFINKKSQQKNQNAFHHRRDNSANPYIGQTPQAQQQEEHQNLKQYQNQVDQLSKEENRNSRWRAKKNAEKNDVSNNNSQNDLSSRRAKKQQKSQDSFKNVLIDENHPSVNPHVLNHYQVKKRAESYNKQRQNESLDQLDQLINEGIEDNQVEYEYIQSKNMKHSTKGHHREVRAPSSGSSGSQPRVQVAPGASKDGISTASHHSVNSSGVQRRYDSIEHQRQSQIDKFLQSPQDQIATLMSKKGGVQNVKKQPVSGKDNFKKEQYTINPNVDKINLVNILKKNEQSKKNVRNSSKVQGQNTEEDDKNGPQATSQYYKQLQQQLAMLNQRRIQGDEQYNNQNLKETYQDSQEQYEMEARRSDQNKSYVHEKSSLFVKQQQSAQSSNFVSQQNSVKQVHRKAKSMLNQNGQQQNEAYQNQKVQQIKLSDGSIRHLIQQLSTNPQQTNQKGAKEQPVGTAPTMPQAPKSGNVLKLKQQVIKQNNKSRDRADRGGSRGERQTSQPNGGNTNTQTIKKKQTILHTTKNTAGQTHQHNFDIVDAVKQGQSTHQQSVQHPSQIAGVRKSGVNLTTQYSKISQPTPDNVSDGYLQNLLREYEKNNTNKSNVSNNSIPSQVQILSQHYEQQNEQKRSSIKISKIQKQSIKPNQVENIHKNISQNQKVLQNMTQNLFQKNNNGQLQPRHGAEYNDDKSSINFNDSLRGSARNNNQTQAQKRYNPNGAQQVSGQSTITNPRQSSHQKTNSTASNNNVRSHVLNHFQTQDNRGSRGSSNTVSKSNGGANPAEDKQRLKQHPASTTAAASSGKQPGGAYLDNVAANSAVNAAINAMGGMDEVLGKIQLQMELVGGHGSTKNKVSTSKTNKGPVVQQSRGSESRVVEQKTTQMSIMSKYNHQQQQKNPATRHYSAPREGTYGPGLDDDEIKRQHLLNQSVDMSQINNIQSQIKSLNNNGYKNYEEMHKINLSQFGGNPRNSQNQNNRQGSWAHEQQQVYKSNEQVLHVKQSQVSQQTTTNHQRKKSNFDFNSTQGKQQTAITAQKSYGQADNSSRGPQNNNVIMGNVNLTVQMNHNLFMK